jgi:hypothetical protein
MADEIITPEFDFSKLNINDFSEALKDKPETVTLLSKALEIAQNVAPIKAANKEFSTFKQTTTEKIKQYETKISELEKKANGTKSTEADQNAFELLKKEFTDFKSQAEAKELKSIEEKTKAELKILETQLESTIVTKAGTKATDANALYTLMKAQGLIGIEEGTHFFRKMVDGKPVTTSADDSISSFLDKNKWIAASSGVAGTGAKHNGGNATNNGLLTREQILANLAVK